MTENGSDEILWEAEFNPRVRTYWFLSGTLVLTLTIIGIPLLLIWLPLGYYFTGRYLERMSCTLTHKTLQFSKGFLIRVEKTVPLDKITDIGLAQGPIMRYLDLQALSVETAGQSSQGAFVKLIGVVETEAFRAAVLKQRNELALSLTSGVRPERIPPPTAASSSDEVLIEIRDTLQRIEQKMGDTRERRP